MFSMLLQEPKYALEVYNALNNSDYKDESEVQIMVLENGITLSVRNDASFIVGNFINIYEHQSTVNPNMPLRSLIYVADLYRELIRDWDIYNSKLVRVPNPRFVVLYNGTAKQPEKKELKLSDSYFHEEENLQLELTCIQYNINPGHNSSLKDRCPVLAQYIMFCEDIQSKGPYTTRTALKEALRETVMNFIDRGILKDFLERRGDEVIEMETLDYTFERRLELNRKEYYEEGHEAGLRLGMKRGLDQGIVQGSNDVLLSLYSKGIITADQAANELGITVEKFLSYTRDSNEF